MILRGKPVIHQIVFKHYGEQARTAKDPFVPLSEFNPNPKEHGDINQTVSKLISNDNWDTIRVNLYEVRPVTLPDWLSPAEYCYNHVMWEKMPSVLGDLAFTWPEIWVRKVLRMDNELRDVCMTLLNTKQFRSQFRKSCRVQLENWLDHPNPQYERPFSDRQLAYLMPPRR